MRISKKTLILIFLFPFFRIFSETVILNNETVIRGKVNSQDAQNLTLTDESGIKKVYSKNDILKVVYRDVTDKKELDNIILEEKKKKGISTKKEEKKSNAFQFFMQEYFFKVNPPKSEEKRSRWSIVWRSALIPGWGQFKAGDKWYKNIGAISSFVLTGAALINANSKINALDNEQKNYQNLSLFVTIGSVSGGATFPQLTGGNGIFIGIVVNNSLYKAPEQAAISGNQALRGLGIVYGIQLIHSYFVGVRWENAQVVSPSGKVMNEGFNFDASQKYSANQTFNNRETYYESSYVFTF